MSSTSAQVLAAGLVEGRAPDVDAGDPAKICVQALTAAAILRNASRAACLVVAEGKVVRRPVELGLRSGSAVEIASGIDENQLIVQKQPETLKPGPAVRTMPPAP